MQISKAHLVGEIFGRRDHCADGGVADRAGGAVVDGHGDGVTSIFRVRVYQKRLGTLVSVGLAATGGTDFLFVSRVKSGIEDVTLLTSE